MIPEIIRETLDVLEPGVIGMAAEMTAYLLHGRTEHWPRGKSRVTPGEFTDLCTQQYVDQLTKYHNNNNNNKNNNAL